MRFYLHVWRSTMCTAARAGSETAAANRALLAAAHDQDDDPWQQQAQLVDFRLRKKNLIKELVKQQIRDDVRKRREEAEARAPKTEKEFLEIKIRRALNTIYLNRKEIWRKYSSHLTRGTKCLRETQPLSEREFEHYRRIGTENKNFASVGKRGVYGGVIHNIHTNWKFHETVQIQCPRHNTMEATRRIAAELARLSGGVVVDVLEDRTVIMFRGKNYQTPDDLYPEQVEALNRRKADARNRIQMALNTEVYTLGRYLSRYRFIKGDDEPPLLEEQRRHDADTSSDSTINQLCEGNNKAREEVEQEKRSRFARELSRHKSNIKMMRRRDRRKQFDYKVRRLGGLKPYLRSIGVPLPFEDSRSYS